jgi:hypothetical protein
VRPLIPSSHPQILIKLKTTVGTGFGPDRSGCDKDGFKRDGFAYNVNCLHFFGWLRSETFKKQLADVRQEIANLRGGPVAAEVTLAAPAVAEEEEEDEEVEDVVVEDE